MPGKYEKKKVPLGPAAGETSLYAVSLALFMICGIWFPHRNFHLIIKRIGQGGELPKGSINASELTDILFNWQGLLIVVFVGLVIYYWWTSTWKESTARKTTRFLLWCIPSGLYILMLWILYWLTFPLKMMSETLR